MKEVICVGSSLVEGDGAGMKVHARLVARPLPAGVAVRDGGLAGIDLVRHVEGSEAVVFVDTVEGFAGPGEVVVLDGKEVASRAAPGYDHGAGLPYLLRLLPALLGPDLPPIHVVGVELPASDGAFDEAARRALALCGAGDRSAP